MFTVGDSWSQPVYLGYYYSDQREGDRTEIVFRHEINHFSGLNLHYLQLSMSFNLTKKSLLSKD